MCVTVTSIVTNVIAPILFKGIIDSVLSEKTFIILCTITSGYCLIWVFSQITEQLRELMMCRYIEKSISNVTQLYYENKIKNRETKYKGSGSDISLLTLFHESFPNLIWGLFFFIIPLSLQALLSLLIIGTICGFIYSLIFCAMISSFVLITYVMIQRYLMLQKEAINQSMELYDFLSDRFLNIENVYLFGSPAQEKIELKHYLNKNENTQTNAKKYFEKLRIYQGVIVGLGLFVSLLISLYAVFYKRQSLGDFILIHSYTLQFLSPMTWLGFVIIDITKGLTEVQKIFSAISTDPTDVEKENDKIYPHIKTIEVKNLSFSYKVDSDTLLPVLEDISFSILQGESLAIVGRSGSGKSTLAKLLSLFFVPRKGEIRFNGLLNYNSEILKKHIALIPQTIHLFNQSLSYNILYANHFATKKDLDRVIELAELKDFIKKLPKGLDTQLGELGSRLSGGERQRIALARALLKNPSCIIFDEFSAHLDPITLSKIKTNLLFLPGNVIKIFISHQLNTLSDVDKILVLKDGKLVETGTHADLLSKNGLYLDLWK